MIKIIEHEGEIKILKYPLEITDRQYISMGNSEGLPLSVAEQNGKLVLWARVQENVFPEGHNTRLAVHIIGTGTPIESPPEFQSFIGTVIMSNSLVWHVFAERDNNGARWCLDCGKYYTDPPARHPIHLLECCPACAAKNDKEDK